MPVVKGIGASAANAAASGISISDTDGAAQTQALSIAFDNLPQGASYDLATSKLLWTPGPGQTGDFTITARVSDGHDTTIQTFTLRVVADADANKPAVV